MKIEIEIKAGEVESLLQKIVLKRLKAAEKARLTRLKRKLAKR
jgi:hypothetical protein